MRKLNKQNKAYIIALSSLVAIVFIALCLFIVYKLKDISIKYDVYAGSYVYNSNKELVSITNDTYIKKNFLGTYCLLKDDKKITIGDTAIIYNSKDRTIKLLGTFYEIKDSGEVNKIKGETDITNTVSSRLFKISDRKYLVIGDVIVSSDNTLTAKDYLIIDIDKQGNGYLYNNEINVKSFNDLVLNTEKFSLKVNSEKLIFGNEEIDLSKINGSTNEYKEKEVENTTESGNGTGGGSGTGTDNKESVSTNTTDNITKNESTNTNENENIYPEDKNITEEVINNTVVNNKYISRKTSILSVNPSINSMIINYVVYDPFTEYEEIYFNLYLDEVYQGKYIMDASLSSYELDNLLVDTEYRLEFHYSYFDSNEVLQDVIFDSVTKSTDTVTGTITLDKVTNNSVSYILKIDKTVEPTSCTVNFYIDGVLVEDAFDVVNIKDAISKGGYSGKITYTGTGSFGLLKLENCVYNDKAIDIKASYKYKI